LYLFVFIAYVFTWVGRQNSLICVAKFYKFDVLLNFVVDLVE
jgi:hypothetical protein